MPVDTPAKQHPADAIRRSLRLIGAALTLNGVGGPLHLTLSGPGVSTLQVIDVGGNTILSAACFAEGTGIATPGGRIAIERLRVGDLVHRLAGPPAPIMWAPSNWSVFLSNTTLINP